jgi:hypothetical protein
MPWGSFCGRQRGFIAYFLDQGGVLALSYLSACASAGLNWDFIAYFL